jgi:hypothetical protein
VAAGEEGEKSREWWEDSQLRERGKREKGKRKMRARCLELCGLLNCTDIMFRLFHPFTTQSSTFTLQTDYNTR